MNNYISKEGYNALKVKMAKLKAVSDDLIEQIALNRSQETGDESENNEYMRLMAEVNSVKKKEADLSEFCSNCTIVDLESKRDTKCDKVRFGCTVKLVDIETDKEHTFTILGAMEANPKENSISYQSPTGSALIGKSVGDEIAVDTPKGDIEYEILDIYF
ncbi:GreA/GreB family elongation factor [Vibrio crassostreae]|uniref:GreA/GreB family elongation factor n=1 Tax=Vibrio crassostreae TaxID=246167 RepID=UPI001B318487|nr:GreA/GreB family elongation factor [Vibrio crassostreae]